MHGNDQHIKANLAGTIALVTGASRGAGRGIACALGDGCATVIVTGRSTRDGGTTHERFETIDESAELVASRGGKGIAIRCDHANDDEVESLFERIRSDFGSLDVCVVNAWGGYEADVFEKWSTSFWEQPVEVWDRMISAGLRSHMITSTHAARMMVEQQCGLIVLTLAKFGKKYHGTMSYDVVKTATARMAWCMAEDLRNHNVAVLALAPGWMRTEKVLEHFKVDESNWQTVADLEKTESPEYAGRAVAALASDKNVIEKTGRLFEAGELAQEYGFEDIDGRQVPPFSQLFPELF